jgi:photosystem II stability/assembly factor-like uncharacterized protein
MLWSPKQLGLPTHATILALAVSPRDPRPIFAGAYDTTGAYVSTDQAHSWRAINDGLDHASVFALQFVGGALFAGTTVGLFQWRDDHWERIAGVPAVSVYSIERGMDGAMYLATDTRGIFTSTDDGKTWTHLPGLDDEIVAGVAALDARTIFAGTSGHGAFVTRDRGVTWHALDIFQGEYVSFLCIDPRDAHTLYLRTRRGLFRSRDAGVTWQLMLGGIQAKVVNALLFDFASPRIYAATDSHGVFVSENDGATWQSASVGLPQGVATFALAQLNAQTVLAGMQNGIYLSRDAGNTWQSANIGLGVPQVHALDLDPQTGTLFAATEDGLYQSGTNGKFVRMGDEPLRLPVLAVAMAPSNQQVIYVGTYRRGIFVTRDGGASWNSAGDIFQNRLTVPGLAVDPQDHQKVFARVLFERIYKSSDGGAAWHAVWTGMPTDAQVGAISFAPGDPTQMFAGTNIGLFSSRDAGESWTPRGLAQQTVFAVWIDPRNSRVLLAGATDGLYRSDDGGATWTSIALAHITVTAVVCDLRGGFYIGTKYNGVWTGRDDGKTWTRFGLDDDSITALSADNTRGILYAATARGLFKSSLLP